MTGKDDNSDLDDLAESADFLDFDPGERATATPGADPGLVRLFLRWFAGRGDVHARQWFDARQDRCGYWPVRTPLTPAVAERHLLGRETIGQYVLFPDNTVSFAALDLDPTEAALAQLRVASDPRGSEILSPLIDYARRIAAAAQRAQVPAVVEDTGGDGMHLWWFFEPRLRAAAARDFLREILWRAGPQPPAVSVELFPKQDRLTGKGLGNLIKLPLGLHQKTMQPSRLLDADLRPLPPWDGLARIRACPRDVVERLSAARVVPLPRPTATAATSAPAPQHRSPPHIADPRALAEALAMLSEGEAIAAVDRMLAGCAVLRELARKAHEEQWLSADEARALVYSVGLAGRQNRRIEEMLAKAGVPRRELDRARKGLQAPIGCKRLRERLAGATAPSCACPNPDHGYATPALFAVTPPRRPSRSAPELPLADLVDDLTTYSAPELLQRIERIERQLQAVEVDTRPPGESKPEEGE
jgi:hypothetical protein